MVIEWDGLSVFILQVGANAVDPNRSVWANHDYEGSIRKWVGLWLDLIQAAEVLCAVVQLDRGACNIPPCQRRDQCIPQPVEIGDLVECRSAERGQFVGLREFNRKQFQIGITGLMDPVPDVLKK